MSKPIRNFFWPIPNQKTKDALDLFVKLSIVRGVSHHDVLTELVTDYNRRFINNHPHLRGVDLVDERTLRDTLRSHEGTPVSRVFLSRNRENLRPQGTTLFWTDGRRVVYNLSACKGYFARQRKAA